ncbi:MAG: hypothetical protein IJX13_08905, partial [Clostridia bacterium]|nr:hypothetical protein [Clostridia bacterium]
RLFCAGNLRFSFASTIKYGQIMDENCGVKPQSKNQGGVDQMRNAFERPPPIPSRTFERGVYKT